MGLTRGEQTTITTTRHKRNIHLGLRDLSGFHVSWLRFETICSDQIALGGGGTKILLEKKLFFGLQDGKTHSYHFLQMPDIGTTHMREVPKVPRNG